jgi:hypothetical protein
MENDEKPFLEDGESVPYTVRRPWRNAALVSSITIPKLVFVHDVMTENGAADIARHFCPLLPDESI